jgi:hypothetical protein
MVESAALRFQTAMVLVVVGVFSAAKGEPEFALDRRSSGGENPDTMTDTPYNRKISRTMLLVGIGNSICRCSGMKNRMSSRSSVVASRTGVGLRFRLEQLHATHAGIGSATCWAIGHWLDAMDCQSFSATVIASSPS